MPPYHQDFDFPQWHKGGDLAHLLIFLKVKNKIENKIENATSWKHDHPLHRLSIEFKRASVSITGKTSAKTHHKIAETSANSLQTRGRSSHTVTKAGF